LGGQRLLRCSKKLPYSLFFAVFSSTSAFFSPQMPEYRAPHLLFFLALLKSFAMPPGVLLGTLNRFCVHWRLSTPFVFSSPRSCAECVASTLDFEVFFHPLWFGDDEERLSSRCRLPSRRCLFCFFGARPGIHAQTAAYLAGELFFFLPFALFNSVPIP